MPKSRAEIKEKPGYEPFKMERDWMRDLIGIRVPDLDNDGEPQVVNVGINGVHYNIPRGHNVRVPRLVAENLRTRIQPQWAMPAKNPLQGLVYLGNHSRFYVMELSPQESEKAPEVKPAKPLAPAQRLEVEQQLTRARQDELTARAEIQKAPVHADLKE